MKKLFLGLIFWGVWGSVGAALALPPKAAAMPLKRIMVPHRAIYELSLSSKHQAISVSGIKGRMVFELKGSPCVGYTQKMRMITKITDGKGRTTLLDARSNTWEKGNGQTFLFESKQYSSKLAGEADANQKEPRQRMVGQLVDFVAGSASRDRKNTTLSIAIKVPNRINLELPGDVLFPTQHSLALQDAAIAGKKQLDVRVYDGSEQGQGFYKSFSFIGNKFPPLAKMGALNGSSKRSSQNSRLAALGLTGLTSWPVAVSYFKVIEGNDDEIPVYELSFRMFENGVSSGLVMNHGHFSVLGRLEQLTFLPHKPCDLK